MADQLICYTAFEIDGPSASSRSDVVAKMVFFLRGQGSRQTTARPGRRDTTGAGSRSGGQAILPVPC